jgi:hypothetical protein
VSAVFDGCVAAYSARISRSLQEHGFLRIFGGFGAELIFKRVKVMGTFAPITLTSARNGGLFARNMSLFAKNAEGTEI